MSYIKEYFHNIKCDRCGALVDEELWHIDEASINGIMSENGFIEVDGKHYCQNCYTIDDDDNITILSSDDTSGKSDSADMR